MAAKANFEAAIKIVEQQGVTDPSVIDYLKDMLAATQGNI